MSEKFLGQPVTVVRKKGNAMITKNPKTSHLIDTFKLFNQALPGGLRFYVYCDQQEDIKECWTFPLRFIFSNKGFKVMQFLEPKKLVAKHDQPVLA